MGVKTALYLFGQPAFSSYFKFTKNQEVQEKFGSWLCSRADVSLGLRTRIREKNLLCTPLPSCAQWVNAFIRGFGQAL